MISVYYKKPDLSLFLCSFILSYFYSRCTRYIYPPFQVNELRQLNEKELFKMMKPKDRYAYGTASYRLHSFQKKRDYILKEKQQYLKGRYTISRRGLLSLSSS